MNYSNYRVTLDIRKTVASVQLNAKKGDTGRKIYITLSDHGVPCKIADGCYAVFAGTKPDGTLLYNKTTVEDNTIIYAMTQQTTAVAGLVACEVKLFDSMSNLLTSPKLTILVDDVVVPDEEVVSKDEVSALAELISEATAVRELSNQAVESCNAAAEGAIAAAQTASVATENADAAATEANTAAATATAKANEAEAAAATANNAAALVDQATTNANNAANEARTATEETNTARKTFLQDAGEILSSLSGAVYATPIECAVTGDVIAVKDASSQQLAGLNIYGKTTQSGTPTPQTPVPLESAGESGAIRVTVAGNNLIQYPYVETSKELNGITFTDNGDGSISVKGTATAAANFWLCYTNNKGLSNLGKCFLSTGTGNMPGRIMWTTNYGNGNAPRCNLNSDIDLTDKAVGLAITVLSGATVDTTFYPMLNVGETALPYEPYKQTQTLTASTEGGLHGIGDVCDEIDFARGVRVQRMGRFVVTADDIGGIEGTTAYTTKLNDYLYIDKLPALCNRFTKVTSRSFSGVANANAVMADGQCGHWYLVGNTGRYFYFKSSALTDLATAKAWFAANETVIYYPLAEPIETPLSAEELASFAALHSHKPNTTAFNDGGAGLKLAYNADTKLYIDNKFNELATAILNNA